ncbi:MAG: hypothetical protein N4A49_14300 [Marinifilaceae bacterium]|jgi:hypothetical protein|nr:hypothetical protein [Marinifilaceae bacterium]
MKKQDLAITISAITISLCAFFVSIYQSRILNRQTEIMQEQKHAAVWPRLFIAKNTSNNIYQFTLQNDGVGPAIIKYVEVRLNGKIEKSWRAMINKICPHDLPVSISMINNRVVKPGETIFMCGIHGNEAVKEFIKSKNKNISIDIYYESIYGRIWRLYQESNKSFCVPVSVDSYPSDTGNSFQN